MINRDNYLLIKKFMDYKLRVKQNDQQTVTIAWLGLRHLLEWADSTPLNRADRINNTFPEYLLSARRDDKDKPLTPKYMQKCFEQVRQFYSWSRIAIPEYRNISELWLETFRLRKSRGIQSVLSSRNIWTVEDVIRVINAPTPIQSEKRFMRDKAALAFLFLSGMRIGAFVTMPIKCVDIDRRRVMQLPEEGVHTKNTKAAITFLLPVPELLEVVKDWDKYVNGIMSDKRVAWYPSMTVTADGFKPDDVITQGQKYTGKRQAFCRGLVELCDIAGVSYKSPHKLRHGHGVYGVKHARNMAELKAVSQNLMHANVGITDGIYGRLPEEDISEIIFSLG